MKAGHGTEDGVQVGPLINAGRREEVTCLVGIDTGLVSNAAPRPAA